MAKFIFLDSLTPWLQALHCLIMFVCGVYCVRSASRRRNTLVKLLGLSCFVASIILLGFFLSAYQGNQPLFPLSPGARQTAYLVARVLAPFETIFFGVLIFLIARKNMRASSDSTPAI